MNNLQKKGKTLTLIAVIAVLAILTIQTESVNAASLQPSKSSNTSIKKVRKRIITPNKARNFLNDLDMPTRDYVNTWGPNKYGKYEADSDSFILESRDINRYKNNLSYSVFGDKYVAKAAELDLNVNDLSYKASAIAELIKYSDSLMYKVTGKKLTPEMKKAIQKQTNGEWVVNGYKITLKKDTFPDEKIIKGIESTSDHGAFSLTFLIDLFN